MSRFFFENSKALFGTRFFVAENSGVLGLQKKEIEKTHITLQKVSLRR